ncbi:thiazole biosynthesis adenylyltransferase ThiF [Sporolactobacillus shoreae]|uniref:Thiazole biosynthesis adenylyltransferase ThiF n=1 Tax=Sporolactobacillus shoreae TaxID=1465501 RepID=A0A4Z0GT74_9BACL|nr:thiazole biosynthesis adenylyltransferase ThiF [Sporolactobacillus shoreae]TGA99901.1 thiazole biosynthesis adenylyltransferase ThiF [Sporolactobacillus shoreae]
MDNRYSRQELFSNIGVKGQKMICSKHVVLVGAGALGSVNAEILTRSGVGQLTIIDRDYVEWSNLHRQQLYTESDAELKLPKAIAAKKHLEEINSEVSITARVVDATVDNLEGLLRDADLIIDATDNFDTRFVINDLSQKLNIPWIYGACVGSYGMSFTIIPGKTPCMNCLLKSIPIKGLTCETGGIIAPVVQMVAAHQTSEALKILVEDWEAVRTTFVTFDLWNNEYYGIKVSKARNDECLSCGKKRTYPFLSRSNLTKTTVLCGRETVQVRPPKPVELNFVTMSERLKRIGYDVKANPYLMSVQYAKERLVLFKDGRALIHGTKDRSYARTVYQRIIG